MNLNVSQHKNQLSTKKTLMQEIGAKEPQGI